MFKAPEKLPEGGAAPLGGLPLRAAAAGTPLCTVLVLVLPSPVGHCMGSSGVAGAALSTERLDTLLPCCTAIRVNEGASDAVPELFAISHMNLATVCVGCQAYSILSGTLSADSGSHSTHVQLRTSIV